MRKLMLLVVASLFVGCSAFRAEEPRVEVNNATVVLTTGHNLRAAVVQAATRRHWVVREQANGDIRCQILQRSNVVTIDIVIVSETAYSIKFVESNIPNRKYNQWITALQREIAKWAVQ